MFHSKHNQKFFRSLQQNCDLDRKDNYLTNTSAIGCGIHMSNAKVELFDVALKGCGDSGLRITHHSSEATVVATRCEFANSRIGAAVLGSLSSATFKNCVFFFSIVRISESLAKLTLSREATPEHVAEAIRLFKVSTGHAANSGSMAAEGFLRPEMATQIQEVEDQIKRRVKQK